MFFLYLLRSIPTSPKSSDALRRIVEPLTVGLIIEVREDAFTHCGVIFIDLRNLLGCEHGAVNRPEIVGAEGKRLETVEPSEIRCAALHTDKDILNARTETSFNIETWLIRHSHPRAETHSSAGTHIFTNLLRSLVHTKVSADAMACAVTKVVTFVPHMLTSGEVQLQACRTIGELLTRKGEMSL